MAYKTYASRSQMERDGWQFLASSLSAGRARLKSSGRRVQRAKAFPWIRTRPQATSLPARTPSRGQWTIQASAAVAFYAIGSATFRRATDDASDYECCIV